MVDAPSETFGLIYGSLIAIAVVSAVALRTVLTAPDASEPVNVKLSPVQFAWLAGGPRRVVYAVMAALAQREAVRPVEGRRRIGIGRRPPSEGAVERLVWSAINGLGEARPQQVVRACQAQVAGIGDTLRAMRLAPDARSARNIRWCPALIASSPALVGLARLAHRVEQHRAVALLALLCAVPPLIGAAFVKLGAYRSRRGSAALAAARVSHQSLETIGFRRAAGMGPGEITMAVALFGPTPMRDNPLAWLADLLWPPSSTGGDTTDADWGSSDHSVNHGGSGSDPF